MRRPRRSHAQTDTIEQEQGRGSTASPLIDWSDDRSAAAAASTHLPEAAAAASSHSPSAHRTSAGAPIASSLHVDGHESSAVVPASAASAPADTSTGADAGTGAFAEAQSHTAADAPADAHTVVATAAGAPIRNNSELEPACSICLDSTLHDAATLDCCSHRFCFSCVYQWTTRISSTCPLCKAAVHTITHAGAVPEEADDDDDDVQILDSPGPASAASAAAAAAASSSSAVAAAAPGAPIVVFVPEKLQRVTWEADELEALPEEIRFARCGVCHRDDDEAQLLLCDGCDQALHTYCVGLAEVPEGDFFCANCQRDRDAEEEEEEEQDDAAPKRRRLRRARESAPREPRARSRASSSAWQPDSISSRRPHLARGVRASSLDGLRVQSSRDDAISRLASQLAGLPSRPAAAPTRAATAATSRAAAARAAATTAARAQSLEGDAWRARQALSFMAQRRQTRQRQHERRPAAAATGSAAAASSSSGRGPSSSLQLIASPPARPGSNGSAAAAAFNQPSLQRHIQSFEQQQSQRNQLERAAQRPRPAVAPISSTATAYQPSSYASASSSQPIRRRIPKKDESMSPVLMRVSTAPSHFPSAAFSSSAAAAASPTLALAFGRGHAASSLSSPPPHAHTHVSRQYPSGPMAVHSPLPSATSTARPPVAPSSLSRIPSPLTVSHAERLATPVSQSPLGAAAANGAPRTPSFWNVGSPVPAPHFSRAVSTPVNKPAAGAASSSMPRSHEASPTIANANAVAPSVHSFAAAAAGSDLISPPPSFAAPSPLSSASAAAAALPPMPTFSDFESTMLMQSGDDEEAQTAETDAQRERRRRSKSDRRERHAHRDEHRRHRHERDRKRERAPSHAHGSSDGEDARRHRKSLEADEARASSHRHDRHSHAHPHGHRRPRDDSGSADGRTRAVAESVPDRDRNNVPMDDTKERQKKRHKSAHDGQPPPVR